MQDVFTRSVARYISDKGISVAAISEKTGLPYNPLIASLSPAGKRKLRADEYMEVCRFLDVDPRKFVANDQSA